MTQAIVTTSKPEMGMNEMATAFAASGFFADSRVAAQCIVKIQAGRELGFPPVVSMTGIHIITGRVSLSANLLAAAVKRSGKYTYVVTEHTPQVCRIKFYEGKTAIGDSVFDAVKAQKAGTKNMDKWPEAMLFARALSQGVRWHCPDVTGGPVYVPEELGAEVNADGEIEIPAAPEVERLSRSYVETLEPRMADRGKTLEALIAAIKRSGVEVGSDPEQWPAELQPRIEAWLGRTGRPPKAAEPTPAQPPVSPTLGLPGTSGTSLKPPPPPTPEPPPFTPARKRTPWPRPARMTPSRPAYWRARLEAAVEAHLAGLDDTNPLRSRPAAYLADGLEAQHGITMPPDAAVAPESHEYVTAEGMAQQGYRALLSHIEAGSPSVDWEGASLPF